MKTYLLCAASVIFLSVIVTLLIPEGKLHKTVTFAMRMICIFVLIQPLTGIFDSGGTSLETDLADYVYVAKVYSEHQSEQLEKLLAEEFGGDYNCLVEIEYLDGQFKVSSVTVETDKNSADNLTRIHEYLAEKGYINITVYATAT